MKDEKEIKTNDTTKELIKDTAEKVKDTVKDSLKDTNIHQFTNSPGVNLFLALSAFFISAWATYMSFAYSREGMDYLIGILKTVVLEGCKLTFYLEVKRNGNKKSLVIFLWIFFLFLSLVHTMACEVGWINTFNNRHVVATSEYNDSRLKKVTSEYDEKLKQINKYEKQKETVDEMIGKDKKTINELSKKNFDNLSKNMQEAISSYANNRVTNKKDAAREKGKDLNQVTENTGNILLKFNTAISDEKKRISGDITTSKKELSELKAEMDDREKKKEKLENKKSGTVGYIAIIDLIMQMLNFTLEGWIIFVIVLLSAIAFDLAGCKQWEIYNNRLKELGFVYRYPSGKMVTAESYNQIILNRKPIFRNLLHELSKNIINKRNIRKEKIIIDVPEIKKSVPEIKEIEPEIKKPDPKPEIIDLGFEAKEQPTDEKIEGVFKYEYSLFLDFVFEKIKINRRGEMQLPGIDRIKKALTGKVKGKDVETIAGILEKNKFTKKIDESGFHRTILIVNNREDIGL